MKMMRMMKTMQMLMILKMMKMLRILKLFEMSKMLRGVSDRQTVTLCSLTAGADQPGGPDPGLCGLLGEPHGPPQRCHRGHVGAHQVWQRGRSDTQRDPRRVQLCCQGRISLLEG